MLTLGLLAQNQNRFTDMIQTGEVLRIIVAGEPDFTRTVSVQSNGNVAYPLIANPQVAAERANATK